MIVKKIIYEDQDCKFTISFSLGKYTHILAMSAFLPQVNCS